MEIPTQINNHLVQQPNYSESSLSNSLSTNVFSLKAKYPTIANFSSVYNPSFQLASLNKGNRFVYNESPSMKTIAGAYSEQSAKAWMKAQLLPVFGINNLEGDGLSLIDELVDILYERFYYERCSVFILFCAKCRAREYKISYGTVKIDAMLDAANTFLKVDLPIIKAKAGAEMRKGVDKEAKIRESDAWKYVTDKALWQAWLNGTKRLIKERGEKALVTSINTDDEHHEGIGGLIAIGALTVEGGHAILKDEVVNEWCQFMRDKTND